MLDMSELLGMLGMSEMIGMSDIMDMQLFRFLSDNLRMLEFTEMETKNKTG